MNYDVQLGREQWWIDYLEDELEPNLKQDLSMLLHNSLPAQRRLEVLKRLRQLVKECEEAILPEDPSYYDGLHDRIMAAVDGRRPRSRVTKVFARVSPRQLKFSVVLGSSSLTLLLSLVAWLTTGRDNGSTTLSDHGSDHSRESSTSTVAGVAATDQR